MLVLLALLPLGSAETPNETFRVGFLARDGEGVSKSEFAPAINAINSELKSRSRKQRLSLTRLQFEEILPEVRAKQVDFLIIDPDTYVMLEEQGANALATLRRKYESQELSSYGGVIFGVDGRCTVDEANHRMVGKVAAVRPTARDGYGMQKAELERRGIEWDEHSITFTNSHSAVVDEVVAKKADCGFVRTGTLEQFAKNWKFKLSRFQGLFLDGQGQNSRYIMSTTASSEWPFVALAHVDPAVVEIIAFTLTTMKPYANPRFTHETLRWAYPISYTAAREREYHANLRTSQPIPEIPEEPEPIPDDVGTVEDAVDLDVEDPSGEPTDGLAEEAPAPEPPAPEPAAEPAAEPAPTNQRREGELPVALLGVIAVIAALLGVIVWAAYLVGKSAGFSRGVHATADWHPPTEHLPDPPTPPHNDF